MAIPVIDFSKVDASGEERANTMAQIADACQHWGFFQLLNHGISEELLERVKRVTTCCYEMEREENFKNSEMVKKLKDLAEKNNGEMLDTVDWEDIFLLTDNNDWPTETPGFKETMAEYRRELKKLAERVMEVMDENLGLSKGYIKEVFNGGEKDTAFFGTKVSHYPPCPNPELVTGLRAHTDAGGVILLFQDDVVGGLQILKDGNWIDVQPLKNSIVINTGDQIEVLSNGKYKSVWHRILPTKTGNRMSIASFYNPSFTATIAPAPQLAEKPDENQVNLAYPKFVFGDYMDVYAEQKFLPKEPRFQAVKAV